MSTHRDELIRRIRHYRLGERIPYWKTVLFEAEQGLISEDMAELLLLQTEPFIKRQENYPDFTHPPPETQEELYPSGKPDVRLGKIIGGPDLEFGIQWCSPGFVLVAGVPGSGKTTGLRSFCKGVHSFNQRHPDRKKIILLFDRKGFDFGDLPGMLDYQAFDAQSTLMLSMEAPPGVPSDVWINILASIFCARAKLEASWGTLVSVLQWVLKVLNPKPTDQLVWPTFGLILETLTSLRDTTFSAKPEYTQSLVQKLNALVLSSGITYRAARGFQVERDVVRRGRSAVIFMQLMAPSWARQMFTDICIAQALYGRMQRGHRVDEVELIFIVDEADADVSHEAEAMFPDSMCPISQLFRMGREFGLSCWVSVASLNSASRFILANGTHFLIFRMNYMEDVQEAAKTLALPQGGHLRLTYLQPGECLIRQVGPWPHAYVGRIDYVPPSRTRPSHFDTHPFEMGTTLAAHDGLKEALAGKRAEIAEVKKQKTRDEHSGLSDKARRLLALAYDHPYVPAAGLFKSLGIRTFDAQVGIREELSGDPELAVFEEERFGRANQLLMELTNEACEILHRPPLARSGRGKLIHRSMAHWIRMTKERQGFRVYLEWVVPGTNHPVDVAVEVDGLWDLYEVAYGATDNVASSILACFTNPTIVRSVVVVATQKATCKELQGKVLPDLAMHPCVKRVRFESIEPYLKEVRL